MAFCSNCGHQIEAGARFCPACGTATSDNGNSQRNQVFEGNIHKCPNCGETISAFSTKCPSCGYEFRDAQASSAVRDFSRQLQEIESHRKEKTKLSGVAEALGVKSSTDEQKINLIRTFSVPNTKEDVFEFMILASSNIDDTLYENNNSSSEMSVSNAWVAKTEQVYNKAKLAFGTDPDFAKIQTIYDTKMHSVKKSKGKKTKSLFFFICAMMGLLLVLVLMLEIPNRSTDRKIDNLDKQLTQTVAEIQIDISNNDYDSALIKANTLHFDSGLSASKAEDWDEQRESLIRLIKQKQEDSSESVTR